MLSDVHDSQRSVLLPARNGGDGDHLERMRNSLELAELVCLGDCNPQMKAYDAMVDHAARMRSRVHDDGTMAMTAYGVPAWRTVQAIYTAHFRVGLRWQCSKCSNLRKWGDDS